MVTHSHTLAIWLSLAFFATCGLTLANDTIRPYSLSPEDADKKFEAALEAFHRSKPPKRVSQPGFSGPSEKTSARVAKLKNEFKNPNDVIDIRETPPPPPNGLFKAAENGGFVKAKKKGGKKGKGGKAKKGKKRR